MSLFRISKRLFYEEYEVWLVEEHAILSYSSSDRKIYREPLKCWENKKLNYQSCNFSQIYS